MGATSMIDLTSEPVFVSTIATDFQIPSLATGPSTAETKHAFVL